MPLRLVFMGTPDFAVPTLRRLVADGHEVAAVYTRPPKPAGRGMALGKSPVHRLADELGLPVETPKGLRADDAAPRQRGRSEACTLRKPRGGTSRIARGRMTP